MSEHGCTASVHVAFIPFDSGQRLPWGTSQTQPMVLVRHRHHNPPLWGYSKRVRICPILTELLFYSPILKHSHESSHRSVSLPAEQRDWQSLPRRLLARSAREASLEPPPDQANEWSHCQHRPASSPWRHQGPDSWAGRILWGFLWLLVVRETASRSSSRDTITVQQYESLY